MRTNPFKDKVAIVTGSSGGIGKATAIELINQGAKVVLNGRNQDKLLKTKDEILSLGGNAIAVCCDISDAGQAKHLIESTIDAYGRLDILINNAGISMRGDFSELKPEVFKAVFDTNVLGSVYSTLPAIPHIKNSNGSIVFISSLAGIRGLPGFSAYSASKMALRALTESIRIEEANSHIHVGLILVGITEIEEGKKVLGPDGNPIVLNLRTDKNLQSTKQVANAILQNIKTRKYLSVLTRLGKIELFTQTFFPSLAEKILIYSSHKVREKSK